MVRRPADIDFSRHGREKLPIPSGWTFTQNPRLRYLKWKSTMKLAKGRYRLEERLKKEAMKRHRSEVKERRKWAIQRSSWGHSHPKRPFEKPQPTFR